MLTVTAAFVLGVGASLSAADLDRLAVRELSTLPEVQTNYFSMENCTTECPSAFSSLHDVPEGCIPVASLPSAGTADRIVDGRYLVARARSFAELDEVVARLREASFTCVQPYQFSPLLYLASAERCPHEVESLLHEAKEAIGTLGAVGYEVIRIESNSVAPSFAGASGYLSAQWNLASLGIPEAWSYSSGNPAVKVAVIDSGIDLDHTDLVGRIAEGVNFTKGMGLYDGDLPDDDEYSHGTSVASVIGAISGNGFGVDAVDRYCKIVPLKVSHKGHFIESKEVLAIDYAVSIGCRVINVSHGSGPDDVLELAVKSAAQSECVVVGAIGNLNEEAYWLPAASPYAIAVGAINESGQRAGWSTWGDHIDLLAPGENVPCLREGNRNWTLLGTSLAAPHVAACAAILIAADPSLTRREVTLLLYAGADDQIGSEGDSLGWDNKHGWGRLNLLNSLKLALLPYEVKRLEGDRLELSWDVPENLSSQVDLVVETSRNLEDWNLVPEADIAFDAGQVRFVFDPPLELGGEGRFYRLRPVFSQALLDAVHSI